MTSHSHSPAAPPGAENLEVMDPGSQSLADALQKSFRILKLLMLVLVVLYFFSGWFSVRPDEKGLVLRFGRILGADRQDGARAAVLGPGWHWSWPYPFEKAVTVPTSERQMPIEFMFQLSETEMASNKLEGYKFGAMSPLRDDYLITGDLNVLHAILLVKYKITDPVAYVTNVYPMPDAGAGLRAREYQHYEEFSVLRNLVRHAVIATAASADSQGIYSKDQAAFFRQVGRQLEAELQSLAGRGTPLGISVDAESCVLASKNYGVEGILPPRQVQKDFDEVSSAENQKSTAIAKAAAQAQETLFSAAGRNFQDVADAIEAEYQAIRELSRAQRDDKPADEVATLRQRVDALETQTKAALDGASGIVQMIRQDALISRDQIVQDAKGDYDQFMSVRARFEEHPEVFIERRLDEMYERALSNNGIAKIWMPHDYLEIRLKIEPSSGLTEVFKEKTDEKAKMTTRQASQLRIAK